MAAQGDVSKLGNVTFRLHWDGETNVQESWKTWKVDAIRYVDLGKDGPFYTHIGRYVSSNPLDVCHHRACDRSGFKGWMEYTEHLKDKFTRSLTCVKVVKLSVFISRPQGSQDVIKDRIDVNAELPQFEKGDVYKIVIRNQKGRLSAVFEKVPREEAGEAKEDRGGAQAAAAPAPVAVPRAAPRANPDDGASQSLGALFVRGLSSLFTSQPAVADDNAERDKDIDDLVNLIDSYIDEALDIHAREGRTLLPDVSERKNRIDITLDDSRGAIRSEVEKIPPNQLRPLMQEIRMLQAEIEKTPESELKINCAFLKVLGERGLANIIITYTKKMIVGEISAEVNGVLNEIATRQAKVWIANIAGKRNAS